MKFTFFISLFILFAIYDSSQVTDTLYYKNGKVLKTKNKEYDFYRIVSKTDSVTFDVKEYDRNDILCTTFSYKTKKATDVEPKNMEKLIRKNQLPMDGQLLRYSKNGEIIGEAIYDYGISLYGPVEYKNGDTIFFDADIMPLFEGKGPDNLRYYVSKKLKYPESAAFRGIQGKVFIQFIVNEHGEVQSAKVARGADPDLNKEALRVVLSTSGKWKPAMYKGRPVKYKYTMPIAFKLQ
ncbi:MAG: energy transducer TonB [Prolixibacteraceae bacterium]|nr:energy transducer TonB [Prolixibacteraceae bacterium]